MQPMYVSIQQKETGNRIKSLLKENGYTVKDIQGGQFGYATAIGLIQGLVGLVLVVVCNRICKKITEVGLW